MEKIYEALELEIITFPQDIVRTSSVEGGGGGGDTIDAGFDPFIEDRW